MAKSAKKQPETKPQDALPFEEALRQLESLVRNMESEQATLDELIRNYEDGIALYRVCQARIDEAQGRIEKIRKKRDGTIVLEEMGVPGESAPSAASRESGGDSGADLSGPENSSGKARFFGTGDQINTHGELY